MRVGGLKRRGTLAVAAAFLGLLAAAAAQNRDTPVATPRGNLTIEGRVEIVDASGRVPLRRAAVLLRPTSGPQEWTVASDAEGRFRFEDLAEGRYRVDVRKAGFVRLPPTAPDDDVELDRGGQATVAIEVQRAGALEGQLTDDRGLAIERVTVTASSIDTAESADGMTSYSAATDDLGRFRIHTLPPGRYHLYATPASLSGRKFFYPGTVEASEAAVIAVQSGQTIERLNITVPPVTLSPEAADALAAVERQINSPESPGLDGRIAGRVTRSDVGLPIAFATVSLLSSSGMVLRTVPSDGDGRFLFPRLPEGRYSVNVMAPGFVSPKALPPGSRETTFVVAAGSVVRLDLALPPASAIEVKLVDEFGDPAPGIVVRVSQKTSTTSAPVPVAASTGSSTGPTDDRGWSRAFGLQPGEYYVTAVPEPFARSGPAAFAPTYFPGTAMADAADTIRVGAGSQFGQVAFGLVATRTGPISGVVVAEDGARQSSVALALLPAAGGPIPDALALRTATAGDGTFIFRNVPEGAYVLQGSQPGRSRFGVVPVTAMFAADADSRPLVLTLLPFRKARGRVVFDGDIQPSRLQAFMLGVRPTDALAQFAPSGVIDALGMAREPGWAFEIGGLAFPGVVYTTASASPWVLARVLLRGRDITDVPYDFQAEDVDGLEVVVTNRVGAIAGTVSDAGTAAPAVSVMAFGSDKTSPLFATRTTKVTWVDERGAFQITGLLPGRYLVVATRLSSPSSARDDLRARATLVTVTAGGRAEVNLTVVR